MRVAELILGPDARSPGLARRFVTTTLIGWAQPDYDDAVLLVSELVTNATLHARTEIVVRVELGTESLVLSVTDGSARQPVARHYSDHATTGRGLGLVNTLARRWGIDPHADGTKTVWCELTPEPAGGRPDDRDVDLDAFPDLEEGASRREQGFGPSTANRAAA